jgi:hypothetical protein
MHVNRSTASDRTGEVLARKAVVLALTADDGTFSDAVHAASDTGE